MYFYVKLSNLISKRPNVTSIKFPVIESHARLSTWAFFEFNLNVKFIDNGVMKLLETIFGPIHGLN